eukprot:2680275-Prymnesium_polylepis.1
MVHAPSTEDKPSFRADALPASRALHHLTHRADDAVRLEHNTASPVHSSAGRRGAARSTTERVCATIAAIPSAGFQAGISARTV